MEMTSKNKVIVIFNKDVYDKIRVFTEEFGSKEVAGWLTGSFMGTAIHVDNILIPNQTVSGADVDIDEDDLILLRKEYGNECTRIIGHWHSHHNLGAFWSSTDENNMSEIMGPRKRFLFVVSASSHKKMLVRCESKSDSPATHIIMDDLLYTVHDPLRDEAKDWCKEQWDEKVTERVITTINRKGLNDYLVRESGYSTTREADEELAFLMEVQNDQY